MIEVRRLGHATLTTPDLDRQIAYYTDVVGLTLIERDSKRAFLASKQGLEAIALEPRRAQRAGAARRFRSRRGAISPRSRASWPSMGSRASAAAAFRRASPTPSCSRTRRTR